jgi:hypothetical protein
MLFAAEAKALDPRPFPVVDTLDLVEVNHFFDEHGRHIFDQVLFYDWCPRENRLQVRDWRLLRTCEQIPAKAPGGLYNATWWDSGTLRRVQAPDVRETWTVFDPELVEREHLPKEQRRLLSDPRPMVRKP